MSEQAALRVFKTNLGSCHYYFKNGKDAKFRDGRYLTGNAAEIKELEDEIADGNPHIYIDSAEKEISAKEAADPMAALKARIVKEYLEEQEKGRDLGNSDQSAVKPASSKIVAGLTK